MLIGHMEHVFHGRRERTWNNQDHSNVASIRLAAARILQARLPDVPADAADDDEGVARFVGEDAEADIPVVVICDELGDMVDWGVDGLADDVMFAFASSLKELMID